MSILLKDLPEEIRENLEDYIYKPKRNYKEINVITKNRYKISTIYNRPLYKRFCTNCNEYFLTDVQHNNFCSKFCSNEAKKFFKYFDDSKTTYKLSELPKIVTDNLEDYKIIVNGIEKYKFKNRFYLLECIICNEKYLSKNKTQCCSRKCFDKITSERMTKRIVLQETREKISKANTGRISTLKNKTLEEIMGEERAKELKMHYSKIRKGKLVGEKNGRFGDHRTYEELHGIEKAEKLKKEKSILWTGENNCNYGDKHWIYSASEEKKEEFSKTLSAALKGLLKGIKRGTYEEQYGEVRANEIKEKLSLAGIAREIPPAEKCSYGIGGWYNGHHFRSIFELSFLMECYENNIQIESAENKTFMVKYIAEDKKERRYFPDFYLPEKDLIIEIKPIFKLKEKNTKLKLQAAYKKYGNKYKVIITPKINYIDINTLKNLYEDEIIKLDNHALRRIYK